MSFLINVNLTLARCCRVYSPLSLPLVSPKVMLAAWCN